MGITLPKTKIVCTIGPACDTPETIQELISNGMSVARLKFSHGTHQDHGKKIQIIRKIARDMGKPVAILQDLGGPKIRIGHAYMSSHICSSSLKQNCSKRSSWFNRAYPFGRYSTSNPLSFKALMCFHTATLEIFKMSLKLTPEIVSPLAR